MTIQANKSQMEKLRALRAKQRNTAPKNNYSPAFEQRAIMFEAEKIEFTPEDKAKRHGKIIGFMYDVNNNRKDIEIYIPRDKAEINYAKKAGSFTGGAISKEMEEELFEHEFVNPRTQEVTKEPSKHLKAGGREKTPFTPKVESHLNAIFPDNKDTQKLLLIADNPKKMGTRTEKKNGQSVEVTIYEAQWIRTVSVSSQLANNVFNNCVFSIKPRTLYADVVRNNKNMRIPVVDFAEQVLVWQTDKNGDLKAVAFSDEDGVEYIMQMYDEVERIKNYATNETDPNDKAALHLFEMVQRGWTLSYNPTVSFGICLPVTEDDLKDSASKLNHTSKMILMPQAQLQRKAVIKIQRDADGNPILDEDGNTLFVEKLDENGEFVDFEYETYTDNDGNERVKSEGYNRLDVMIAMEDFRAGVHDPEDNIHKFLKENYPDLDIDSLNDDNFVIFPAKAYALATKDEKDFYFEKYNKFIALSKDETKSEAQKAMSWNNGLVISEQKGKTAYRNGVVYDYDGNLTEEMRDRFKYGWAVYALLSTYATSENAKEGRKGVFNALRGIVVGGALTENENKLYFTPSAFDVTPFNYNARNLASYMKAPNFVHGSEDGGMMLPLSMFKKLSHTTDKSQMNNKADEVVEDASAVHINSTSNTTAIPTVSAEEEMMAQQAHGMMDIDDDIPF